MSAGWAAAAVRGGGLLRRRVGAPQAQALARRPSLDEVLEELRAGPYGRELRAGMALGDAQHAVSATVLWHLRVLAGWAPPLGAEALRVMAGGFELANITGRLVGLAGGTERPPYVLGSLATAWPLLAAARSAGEVRAVLRSSPWGDPGTEDLATVRLALQLAWARRVFDACPGAGGWAQAGAALLVARAAAAGALGALGPQARRDADHLLGRRWSEAATPADLAPLVPRPAARAVRGVGDPTELWRAEARWWGTVETEADVAARASPPDASVAVAVAALLLADAWRVRAALACAAAGGGDVEVGLGAESEVADVVA